MKDSTLYILWSGLFVLCGALGFLSEHSAAMQILMTLLSVAHFVPAAVLLYRAGKGADRTTATLIRNLSAASLALTAVLLIATFLTVLAPAWVGKVLHVLLAVLSTPMLCSGYWALSLFLWACLLMGAIKITKTAKKT